MNNQIVFTCPANRNCTKVDDCDRSCKSKRGNGSTVPSKINADAGQLSEFDKLQNMLKDLEQKR